MPRLTPIQAEKLSAAWTCVRDARWANVAPDAIIAILIADHGATHAFGDGAYRLHCCGVRGACAWSRDEGALRSWERLANVALWSFRQGAGRQEIGA